MSAAPAVPVSVIVPVHNSGDRIAACLSSVAAQRLRPQEVVLVDDRGRDDAVRIGRRVLTEYGIPHRVVTHDRNRGIGAARNSGLGAVSGEWVWFLDSDDEVAPEFLETLHGAITAHDADVAVCRTSRVDLGGRSLGVEERRSAREVVPGRAAARLLLRNRLRAYACNKLFRRSVLPAEMFDVGRSYEDFRPVLRLLLQVRSVVLVNDPLYRYTADPSSVSGGFGPHTMDLLAVADDVHAELVRCGVQRRWRTDYLVYRYLNSVLPLANMALRAEHAGRADDVTRGAVAAARDRTRPTELVRLACAGRFRTAATAAVLKATPRLYSAVLARR